MCWCMGEEERRLPDSVFGCISVVVVGMLLSGLQQAWAVYS
jgi:hypothetical protein